VLALIGLGIPWTAPATTAHHLHHIHGTLVALVLLGPAVLNVALGALIAYAQGGRATPDKARDLTGTPVVRPRTSSWPIVDVR
jgi:hypothetical protein